MELSGHGTPWVTALRVMDAIPFSSWLGKVNLPGPVSWVEGAAGNVVGGVVVGGVVVVGAAGRDASVRITVCFLAAPYLLADSTRVRLKTLGTLSRLGATVTVASALPLAQRRVSVPSPAKVQVVARLTLATRVTTPPVAGRWLGVTLKDTTVGALLVVTGAMLAPATEVKDSARAVVASRAMSFFMVLLGCWVLSTTEVTGPTDDGSD
jgi:hypothetical protein